MSSPNYPYPPSNPPQGNPQPGLSPVAYPVPGGNGSTGQYPYPPAAYPGGAPVPQQGTDLSWLLNSIKQNRIWFIPVSLLLILIGYIIVAASELASPAAMGVGWMFLGAGHAILVAFILAATKQVGTFTRATAWIASGVITAGWLCVLITATITISRVGSSGLTAVLIFCILTFLLMIAGIIAGIMLSSKPTEPTNPGTVLLISLFLLLAATTTPVIHAVGMIILLAAAALAVIKPRPAYFVLLGVTAILVLTNFIIGLASETAACFLGLNREGHGRSLFGTLFGEQLSSVSWIYWIIGGLTWAFSLIVLVAIVLAIYQIISRQPVTDLTTVFKNQSRANQYPGYSQQGQYPAYPYPQQPYYGGQMPPADQSGQPQPYPQASPLPQQSFMPPAPPANS